MPQIPSKNKIVETARYLTKSIEGYNFVNRCYLFKKRKKGIRGVKKKPSFLCFKKKAQEGLYLMPGAPTGSLFNWLQYRPFFFRPYIKGRTP